MKKLFFAIATFAAAVTYTTIKKKDKARKNPDTTRVTG